MKSTPLSPIYSKDGMSLTEILIGLSLAGVMVMATTSISNLQNRGLSDNRAIATRDSLRTFMGRYELDPSTIALSVLYRGLNSEGNVALHHCLKGTTLNPPAPSGSCLTPGKCCVATTVGSPKSFNIISPTDPSLTQILAGTTDAPARYRADGSTCTGMPASEECPFEVTAGFSVTCPGGASECATASEIILHASIKQAPSLILKKTQKLNKVPLPPVPLVLSELQNHIDLQTKLRFPSPSGGGTSNPPPSSGILQRTIKTRSGTFTVPKKVRVLYVTLLGGGGGGGQGGPNRNGGGGASSCVRIKNKIWVTPETKYTITVGRGGTGAPYRDSGGSTQTTGADGSPSSFAGTLTINGGQGGQFGQSNGGPFYDSDGVYHQDYDIGGNGHSCVYNSPQDIYSSSIPTLKSEIIAGRDGAGSFWHKDESGESPIPNIAGTNQYGAGGVGGSRQGGPNTRGAKGNDGVVVIEWLPP